MKQKHKRQRQITKKIIIIRKRGTCKQGIAQSIGNHICHSVNHGPIIGYTTLPTYAGSSFHFMSFLFPLVWALLCLFYGIYKSIGRIYLMLILMILTLFTLQVTGNPAYNYSKLPIVQFINQTTPQVEEEISRSSTAHVQEYSDIKLYLLKQQLPSKLICKWGLLFGYCLVTLPNGPITTF